MSKGNVFLSTFQVLEQWAKGTLRMDRLGSGIAASAFVGLALSVGANMQSGFLAADYGTTIALLLLMLIGITLYFAVRYIEARVTMEEAKAQYEVRMLDPKTLEDMITAESKELFAELRSDTELEIARIIAIPAKKLRNQVEEKEAEVNNLHG